MPSKAAYTTLMALVLASIGIKYQASHTNPFQQPSPCLLLFLTAFFCHALASMADMTIIFHGSGVAACETLLWILLDEFWWCYLIINLFLLLTASFCFSNSISNISQLLPANIAQFLPAAPSSIHHMQNMEPQEPQA